jgi:hypothetical protein
MYTRWFYEEKMKPGKVKGFGLPIFLFPAIVNEYKINESEFKKLYNKKHASSQYDGKSTGLIITDLEDFS